jgi:hypothetical protein
VARPGGICRRFDSRTIVANGQRLGRDRGPRRRHRDLPDGRVIEHEPVPDLLLTASLCFGGGGLRTA